MSRVLPILFNTEMVRAILRVWSPKTTTRRCIKGYIPKDARWGYTMFTPKGYISCRGTFSDEHGEKFFKLPCQKGDILYVRETFRPLSDHPETWFEYAADWSPECFENSRDSDACNGGKWIPSIHMPKKAARIWIRVTDVRVERLRDMTLDDFQNEGVFIMPEEFDDPEKAYRKAKNEFIDIWDSTAKKTDKDCYGWNANPWVWVIEFEQCEKPEE